MRIVFFALLLAACSGPPASVSSTNDEEARARLDALEARIVNVEEQAERTNRLAVALGERELAPTPRKSPGSLAENLQKIERERRLEEVERRQGLR